jgi:NAD+ synthase
MDVQKVTEHISGWLKKYSDQSKTDGFVIGISGGIDSAVTSILCAITGKKVICVNMPIHQNRNEYSRGNEHIEFLKKKYANVSSVETDLTSSFETLKKSLPENAANDWLSMANTRARLRMTTLYAIAQANKLLVAGTGNKVEDFGIGFFTKYGDGGVDLSPIADLYKTQVYELAKYLNVVSSIQNAKPTDGLWEDGRSDEDQIGATYPELEEVMKIISLKFNSELTGMHVQNAKSEHAEIDLLTDLSPRQKEVLKIYLRFHNANKHKMMAIPVCEIPKDLMK